MITTLVIKNTFEVMKEDLDRLRVSHANAWMEATRLAEALQEVARLCDDPQNCKHPQCAIARAALEPPSEDDGPTEPIG